MRLPDNDYLHRHYDEPDQQVHAWEPIWREWTFANGLALATIFYEFTELCEL